jgi:hypothetical protein
MMSSRLLTLFTLLIVGLASVLMIGAVVVAVNPQSRLNPVPLPTTVPLLEVAAASPVPAATATPMPVSSSPTSRIPTLPPKWTSTFTPLPTSTRTATPTRTSTPSPTPKILPANVNPLTGETASDPALLDHRPLAVKIANTRPCARPQSGLNEAAIVFEHYVEAWITRFTAIFYGSEVEKIGPIRSARLIDLELPAIFDSMLVMSGESGGVKQRVRASDFAGRVVSADLGADCPPLCRVPRETVTCNDTIHTLYTNTADLHARAAKSGLEVRPTLSGWMFSPTPPKGGLPADTIHVDYLNAPAVWKYDPTTASYLRTQDRLTQTDALTGERLTTANVVVLYAHHIFSDIQESPHFYSLEIQFWGQGRALVFRDGQMFEGMWLRPQRLGLFRLVGASGAPIPLKPGRTWFEFVPLDAAVDAQNGEWTITAPILPEQTPPRR